MPNTFDVSHVISVLDNRKTGVISFYLSMSLLLFFRLFQCRPRFSSRIIPSCSSFADNVFRRFRKVFHIVPQPDGLYSIRRNKNAFLPRFHWIHRPVPMLDCQLPLYDGLIDVLFHTALHDRLTEGNLLQGNSPPYLYNFLETIKTVTL